MGSAILTGFTCTAIQVPQMCRKACLCLAAVDPPPYQVILSQGSISILTVPKGKEGKAASCKVLANEERQIISMMEGCIGLSAICSTTVAAGTYHAWIWGGGE